MASAAGRSPPRTIGHHLVQMTDKQEVLDSQDMCLPEDKKMADRAAKYAH